MQRMSIPSIRQLGATGAIQPIASNLHPTSAPTALPPTRAAAALRGMVCGVQRRFCPSAVSRGGGVGVGENVFVPEQGLQRTVQGLNSLPVAHA